MRLDAVKNLTDLNHNKNLTLTPPPLHSPAHFARRSIPTSRKSKPTKLQQEKASVDSLIWSPLSREEWDDSVSEMTTLASQASYRRAIKQSPTHGKIEPPLSLQYIRERTDIDDPLKGYQLRHVPTGYLQGFVMTTTFTCWVGWFKWASNHPQSGMAGRRGEGFDEVRTNANYFSEELSTFTIDDH